ncbi:SEC-C motif-containing protein [Natranaerovirga hydrolytica]|uniref:SEC-C motif-containing protein n=1 Tax=Natranaerovirga hydrolytica TaxID=680378 RepID=A0A4R1MZF9_9FIRM|nr:SEC-C metal-binding domain-containing protein [Natranaerovirga hydrolytica]TCK98717.1 SEC-C motif-containing protein [Natranaerovirga hydrolytica]
MVLYTKWEALATQDRSEKEYEKFWQDYFALEEGVYDYLLSNNVSNLEGTVSDLATKFQLDSVIFTGFLDGINTSLVTELDVKSLEEDSLLTLEIDFEKLYYNMLDAKANWLYNLPSWNGILTEERRKEITKDYNKAQIVVKDKKIGRNDPCPCGSGQKYKKCCINK